MASLDCGELSERLVGGEIVILDLGQWEDLSPSCEVIRAEDTGIAGRLTLLRGPGGVLCVMEEPRPSERVLRWMRDEPTAEQFITERMSRYERMWDGCGCKIDYYR